MTKYRIIKNGLGTHRVQYRGWFFWHNCSKAVPNSDGFFSFVSLNFPSYDKAKEYLLTQVEFDKTWKNNKKWSVINKGEFWES